jgi:CHAT domain-containing protein
MRRLVWDVLSEGLDGAQTVLVSPDGVMGRIPLQALPGKQPDTFLIEDLSIAVVPVPQMLCERRNPDVSSKSAAPPALVMVGNVDFESEPGGEQRSADRSASAARGKAQRFGSLPGTRAEIEALRRLYQAHFKQPARPPLQGSAATESELRKNVAGAQYLHLATHGFFAPSQFKAADSVSANPLAAEMDQAGQVAGWNPGLLSGIVLAGANQDAGYQQDDGILTAAEVADLNLSTARLVVLSACETGLGQIAGGEGALGLQRAFQIAGARTVVSSLWKVDDAATQLLMAQFYENLWQKRMPTVAAFRQAQLSLLRNSVDTSSLRGLDVESDQPSTSARLSPRLWAAFVISGSPD